MAELCLNLSEACCQMAFLWVFRQEKGKKNFKNFYFFVDVQLQM